MSAVQAIHHRLRLSLIQIDHHARVCRFVVVAKVAAYVAGTTTQKMEALDA